MKVDLHIRIERDLHSKLKAEAEALNVELTEIIVERLSGPPVPGVPTPGEPDSRHVNSSQAVGTPPGGVANAQEDSKEGELGPPGTIYIELFDEMFSLRAATFYEVQQLGTRRALIERRDLKDFALKSKLAEREDKRRQEKHEVDLRLKEAKLGLRDVSITRKKYVSLPCPVPDCPIAAQGVIFESYETLQAHYKEYHPEKFQAPPAREVGRHW